jgi:hypothetical protein
MTSRRPRRRKLERGLVQSGGFAALWIVLDGELIKALQEACEKEKGLRQRGKTPKTAKRKTDADGYDDGAGSG